MMDTFLFTFHGDTHEVKYTKDVNGRPLFSSGCILNTLGYNRMNKYFMKCLKSSIGIHMNTYIGPKCLYFYTKRECCSIIQNCNSDISQTLLTWVLSVRCKNVCTGGREIYLYYDLLSR